MPTDDQELLSRKEVAHKLGVSEWTVRIMVKRKDLPTGIKVAGKLVRWLRRDIDKYILRMEILAELAAEQDDQEDADEEPERKKPKKSPEGA